MKSIPDLCDEYSDQIQVMKPVLHNLGGKKQFFGRIVTLSCPEDNSKVREQLSTKGKGQVLVVDGKASERCAYLGDLLATKAFENGWSGIVINGYIRDVDIIEKIDIGVQALGVYPVKTQKGGLGDVNIPITFAGITFNSGDFLYADNNGILVSKIQLT